MPKFYAIHRSLLFTVLRGAQLPPYETEVVLRLTNEGFTMGEARELINEGVKREEVLRSDMRGEMEPFLQLAHCGHDTPMECNSMGCVIRNPG